MKIVIKILVHFITEKSLLHHDDPVFVVLWNYKKGLWEKTPFHLLMTIIMIEYDAVGGVEKIR